MLTEQQRHELDWEKTDGLMPVIVQHAVSGEVLMLGYMNPEALDKTIESGKVTFFSRTKQRLWTKGETSGNFLNVVSIAPDCDNDTLLVLANPIGPTCHKGTSKLLRRHRSPVAVPVSTGTTARRTQICRPGNLLHSQTVCQRHQTHCAESGRRRGGNRTGRDGK